LSFNIILKEGASCSEDELRGFCHQNLGKFRTPKIMKFVEELPRGASGKVQRLKLLELLTV
ncbi:MAG: long-chain fatty acid--CoA ligase, partial [Burkholderiaceae bacterium]|nr:long-chain fatty acid--CoA ligase [Burkholderiaceae bacterium]